MASIDTMLMASLRHHVIVLAVFAILIMAVRPVPIIAADSVGSEVQQQWKQQQHNVPITQEQASWRSYILNRVLGARTDDFDPHKPLWPLGLGDLGIVVGATLTLFLAAGAGIGGGGVLLPLYIFAGGFSTRRAVALCNITVAGGALANFLCNVRRRRLGTNRPIIDWELVLNMEPATIVGAVLGGYLNAIVPVWSTTVLLGTLLVYITIKLIDRALQTYHSETIAQTPRTLEKYNTGDGLSELLITQPSSADGNVVELADEDPLLEEGVSEPDETILAILRDEQQALPPATLAALLLMAGWVVASDTLKLQLPCGSVPYWLAVSSLVPCALAVLLVARHRLLQKEKLKAEHGMRRRKGALSKRDLKWDGRTTLLYPAFCSLAGVIAGLFGVGGGIIKGPLLLELGVLPDVAAATSATMILLTAGSASVVHISFGFVLPDYGMLLVTLGFAATLLGQLVVYRLIKHLQRRSLIIFLMAAMLGASAALMCIRIGGELERLVHHPEELLEFGAVCRQ